MQTKGINHLALVCRDMAETVAFYEGALGMPEFASVLREFRPDDVAHEPARAVEPVA